MEVGEVEERIERKRRREIRNPRSKATKKGREGVIWDQKEGGGFRSRCEIRRKKPLYSNERSLWMVTLIKGGLEI